MSVRAGRAAHRIAVACAALLAAACTGCSGSDRVADVGDTARVVDTAAPADEEPEPAALRASAGRVRRAGDTLRIVTAGRAWVTLVDHPADDADYLRHTYLGMLSDAPFHRVLLSRFEERAYLLVHAATGRAFEVDITPVASPDGTRLVTASMDLVSGHDPTRLVVWRLAGPARDSAVEEFAHEPERWGPSDARWQGPDTIAFTAHHVGDDAPRPIRRTAGRLVRVGGQWRLVAPR